MLGYVSCREFVAVSFENTIDLDSAGVVGLAAARALAQTGREVLVIERANAIGTGTSSRNSEIIHAGKLY